MRWREADLEKVHLFMMKPGSVCASNDTTCDCSVLQTACAALCGARRSAWIGGVGVFHGVFTWERVAAGWRAWGREASRHGVTREAVSEMRLGPRRRLAGEQRGGTEGRAPRGVSLARTNCGEERGLGLGGHHLSAFTLVSGTPPSRPAPSLPPLHFVLRARNETSGPPPLSCRRFQTQKSESFAE